MTLRFGVAGTGHWANIVHIPGFKARKNIELVGVWGRRSNAVHDIAGRHGIRAFEDFREMLDAVDAISLSVPPAVQADLACIAADAGKHLLLEKPVAPTVEGAERVAAAVERSGVSTVVFFTRRFVPEFERSLAAAGRKPWAEARIRQLTDAMRTGSPYAGSVWRQAEGAALWDIGPHALSVVTAVLGPVERISATWSADRVSRFTAHHTSGARSDAELSLHTPSASVVSEYVFRAGDDVLALPLPTFLRPDAFAAAAGELADNIRQDERHHRCDVRFGLDVVRVLAAADRSIKTGKAEAP